MTDPYTQLGEELLLAARRQEDADHAASGVRAWFLRRSRRLHATAMAVVLVLAGGAVALAASGLLSGSPVPEPQGPPSPDAGTGVPVAGGSRLLALRAADPEGGPPWGMRLVRTTRGELCVQIGRVDEGQLGQLGLDGAFHDDGRFHPLSPDTLPNYTDGYADLTCLLPGEVMLGYAPTQDRNAEWGVDPGAKTARQLRAISWGLLGPHAVSVTYRTATGTQTRPVSPGTGAYMIVLPLRRLARRVTIGGFQSGSIVGHEVGLDPRGVEGVGAVSRIVYRFGSLVCSVGSLAPATKRCPAPPPPRRAYLPTRSLHEPVHVTAVAQSRESCSAAFLLDPCYRAEVEFKAPYAVTSAGSEYLVAVESTCHNATPSSWPIIHNLTRGETVRTLSLGLFNCVSTDEFEVLYLDQAAGGLSGAPHESVALGTAFLGKPLPPGAVPLVLRALRTRVARARGAGPERARRGSR
jgi:hypothetical protein